MKITYFINQYPTVSHSFIRREILALERHGMEVQRISLRGWDYQAVNLQDKAERSKTFYVLEKGVLFLFFAVLKLVITSPVKFFSSLSLSLKINQKSDRSIFHHLISLAEACYVLPVIIENGSKHIHSHFGGNSTEVVMLVNSLGGPDYSFTVHGPEEFDKPQAIHLAEKINRSKFVVAVSSYGRSQLYRWIEMSQWPKVKVVHCGLEKSFYDIEEKEMPSTPKLICVGRLCEQKGQLLLVEACHILNEQSVDFELVLAGDGELRLEIDRMIKQYKLSEKIRITGWIGFEEVRKELLAAKGMVLPSFAEGLPVVIMEAMSLKRPVLTTYIAGIPELIVNGDSGYLFPAGDVDSIVESIKNFLSTPEKQLNQIVETAFIRVTERHDIDIEASKLVEYFEEISQDAE